MKWWVWAMAAVMIVASFPLSTALSKKAVRKGNAGGAVMMAGLAFFPVADPKTAAAIEMIRRRRELGDVEEDADGDRPA